MIKVIQKMRKKYLIIMLINHTTTVINQKITNPKISQIHQSILVKSMQKNINHILKQLKKLMNSIHIQVQNLKNQFNHSLNPNAILDLIIMII